MLREPDAARWRRLLGGVDLPRFRPLRQRFAAPREIAAEAAVARELARPEVRRWLQPGTRVALAVGSRGLAALAELVRATVRELRRAGCEVVIVPAMGSHGGATAAGQRRVLADYGVTETGVGAPIEADMAVREIGRLANGMPVYASEVALACDLLLPLNRVKSHTSFRAGPGGVESGLSKMLVIGLGKHPGAQAIHHRGYEPFAANLLEARTLVLQSYPFRFGLATVENAHGGLARLEAVPREALAGREPELLALAKAWMPRLPVAALDVLLVHEAGKNISGLGMDPNVTGRFASALRSDTRGDPVVRRLALLNLTRETEGNAIGVGLADVTTLRVARATDLDATYINATTSTSLPAARLPLVMPDDELAVKLAFQTSGGDAASAHAAWIRNTSSLETLWLSEPLWRARQAAGDELEPLGPAAALPFDGGRLAWPQG